MKHASHERTTCLVPQVARTRETSAAAGDPRHCGTGLRRTGDLWHRTHSPLRRGFTLPEVLAALVFVGIVLPVVMRGITVSMQASSSARHRVEAAQLARQKLDEFLVVRDPQAFISATGDFGSGWEEYTWTSRAQLGEDGVYDVTVVVAWLEQSREKSFSIATMIYPSTTVTTESTTGGG